MKVTMGLYHWIEYNSPGLLRFDKLGTYKAPPKDWWYYFVEIPYRIYNHSESRNAEFLIPWPKMMSQTLNWCQNTC